MEKQEAPLIEKEVEMPYGIKLSGTLENFSWDTEYTTEGFTKINSVDVVLTYEDSGAVEHISCIMYRDVEYNLETEIRCSVEIRHQHLNHLNQSMIGTLRTLSVENDEAMIANKHDDYETVTYLIDAIGMIHTIANIVSE